MRKIWMLVAVLVSALVWAGEPSYRPPAPVSVPNSITDILPTNGLIAEYRFDEGTGTTLTDYVGGANGTLTGTQNWTGGGFTFDGSSYFTTTLPLTNFVTVLVAGDFVQPDGNYYKGILGSSSGASKYFLLQCYGACWTAPCIWNNGFGKHASGGFSRGFGVLAHVMSASADTLWADGKQYDFYKGTSSTLAGGAPTLAGNLVIGAGPNNNNFYGGLYYVAIYNRALSAAEIAQASYAIRKKCVLRGVNENSGELRSTTSRLIAVGDSLTNGQGATPYVNQMTLPETFSILNRGQPSVYAQEISYAAEAMACQDFAALAGNNIAVVWCGTNDIANSRTPAQAYTSVRSVCSQFKRRGFRVIVITMIDRAVSMQTAKNTFNGYLRGTTYPNAWADALADNATLTADGASANATNFQDGVHLTTTGQGLMAATVQTAIGN